MTADAQDTTADGASRPEVVTRFAAPLSEPRRELVLAVDAVVRGVAPGVTVETNGRFLGYGPFHYRYASGREGDTYVVSMMDGARALSIHIMGGQDGGYLVEANADRLGRVSAGRSCIRVTRLDRINLDVLAELVAEAMDQHRDDLGGGTQ